MHASESNSRQIVFSFFLLEILNQYLIYLEKFHLLNIFINYYFTLLFTDIGERFIKVSTFERLLVSIDCFGISTLYSVLFFRLLKLTQFVT